MTALLVLTTPIEVNPERKEEKNHPRVIRTEIVIEVRGRSKLM
jgi:hypothetical protein